MTQALERDVEVERRKLSELQQTSAEQLTRTHEKHEQEQVAAKNMLDDTQKQLDASKLECKSAKGEIAEQAQASAKKLAEVQGALAQEIENRKGAEQKAAQQLADAESQVDEAKMKLETAQRASTNRVEQLQAEIGRLRSQRSELEHELMEARSASIEAT